MPRGDTQEIIALMSRLFPDIMGGPKVYLQIAPTNTARPFSTYNIIGNIEEEGLEGNAVGAGYLVQIDSAALTALGAQQEADRIREILEGEHFAPSGLSVRADFDSERSLGVSRPDGEDDRQFNWSQDFTLWPGF